MSGVRRNLLCGLVLAVIAVAPAVSQNTHASIPIFDGVWDHPGLPGFEPLAKGPTSLVNLSRREPGNVSNNMQLVGDYHNPILKPATAAS